MLDFYVLAQQCAPAFDAKIMAAIVSVESGYNPYAIGVVGGHLQRQPKNIEEALATANYLHASGWNFSIGLGQINRYNLPKYNITYEQAFEPCENLRVSSLILNECLTRALPRYKNADDALLASFSCYYSGNFTRGFKADSPQKTSYVSRVAAAIPNMAASPSVLPIPVIPDSAKNPSPNSSHSNVKATNSKQPENQGKITQRVKPRSNSQNIRELRGD